MGFSLNESFSPDFGAPGVSPSSLFRTLPSPDRIFPLPGEELPSSKSRPVFSASSIRRLATSFAEPILASENLLLRRNPTTPPSKTAAITTMIYNSMGNFKGSIHLLFVAFNSGYLGSSPPSSLRIKDESTFLAMKDRSSFATSPQDGGCSPYSGQTRERETLGSMKHDVEEKREGYRWFFSAHLLYVMKFCLHSCLTMRDQTARHSLEFQQDFNHFPNQQKYRTHSLLTSGSLVPGLFLHYPATPFIHSQRCFLQVPQRHHHGQ